MFPTPVSRPPAPLLQQADLYNWEVGRATVCFPCVVDAAAPSAAPLDQYHLRYAAHAGNGIGLATAPTPLGPWTPHHGNPVFGLRDAPGLRGHISSPEVARLGEQVAPYFHGPHERHPGPHTGLALPDDCGLSFRLHPRSPLVIAPGGAVRIPSPERASWRRAAHGRPLTPRHGRRPRRRFAPPRRTPVQADPQAGRPRRPVSRTNGAEAPWTAGADTARQEASAGPRKPPDRPLPCKGCVGPC